MQRMKRAAVLLTACLLVFTANYQQFQVSALGSILVPDLGLSSFQFSIILFAPMLFAIVFSIPAGVIADRWGTRWLIAGAVGVSLIGSVMRCFSGDFFEMLCASILLGAAPTALNSSIVKVFGCWFESRTDFAMGWYYAASSGGMAASFALTPLFASPLLAFASSASVLGILGLIWTFVAGRFDEENAALWVHPASLNGEGDGAMFGVQDLCHAARSRSVWIVALILGLGLASTETFLGFLPLALEASTDRVAGGWMTSTMTIGGIIGCIAAPHVRVRFKSYRRFLLVASVLGAMALALVCIFLDAPNAVLLFFTGALTAVCGPTVQGLPYQLPEIGERFAGSAGGIVNMTSLMATFLLPLGISALFGESYLMLLAGAVMCFMVTIILVPLLPSPRSLRGDDA